MTPLPVCGRFMKGQTDADFLKLSDEKGKLLSWVCPSEALHFLLGKKPVEAMLAIGFNTDWIAERLKDGTKFKLVVFPVNEKETTIPTWENLWKLIATAYGDEIDNALGPFKSTIEELDTTNGYPFEGGDLVTEIKNMPVVAKHAHPEFMSKENFLKVPERDRRLCHARGFLDHAVGCNSKFTGTGKGPKGQIEMITLNKPINEIEGHILIDLDVNGDDLAAAITSGVQRAEAV
mmetsp:Transcript_6631/g.10129  ORF Transcript_6631/g.10129 Transcript_6631/m.10129 type:complete len:234 (-) Transcript_6631:220-921(-)